MGTPAPDTVVIHASISKALRERIEKLMQKTRRRSLSDMVFVLLEEVVEQHERVDAERKATQPDRVAP